MVQDHTAPATATATAPGRSSSGARPSRRTAGGVVAAGVLASCLASLGGTAFAATGTPVSVVQVHRSTSAPKAFTPQQDVDAFFAAGYTYADALHLAAIWGSPSVHSAKVRGGSKLLAHWQMPFAPKAAPTTPTAQQDVNAFFAAGYDYSDGLELAAVWGSSSVGGAKATAGGKLLAGQDLPKVPQAFTAQQDVNAFLASGYGYADGLELAAVWGSSSVGGAKATAGAELLAGQDLPTVPKAFTSTQDVAAFSAAGYDHSDAVHLAHLWHSGSVHSAKVHAGARLLAGRSLPLAP